MHYGDCRRPRIEPCLPLLCSLMTARVHELRRRQKGSNKWLVQSSPSAAQSVLRPLCLLSGLAAQAHVVLRYAQSTWIAPLNIGEEW